MHILKLPEVLAKTKLGRSTLYVLVQKKEFPAPRQLSTRAVGWLDSEVSEWIESREKAAAGKR